jgi:hypothetical protein
MNIQQAASTLSMLKHLDDGVDAHTGARDLMQASGKLRLTKAFGLHAHSGGRFPNHGI